VSKKMSLCSRIETRGRLADFDAIIVTRSIRSGSTTHGDRVAPEDPSHSQRRSRRQ